MGNNDYLEIGDDNKVKDSFILPSKREEIKKKKLKKLSPYLKTFKYSIYISIGLLIYIFYQPMILYFSSLLKSNPTIYSYFLFVKLQIVNNTLLGLFFASVLGSIFFLALPSEAIFIYFLDSTNYNFLFIILIMVIGNIIGLLFNYGFGRIMGERVLRFIFKEKKFFSYQEKIDKYGGLIIFFGNIFPGPVEIFSVFYGGFKYNLKQYLFLSFMGRLIKYVLLFLAFKFYWIEITYYWLYIKGFF